MKIFLFLIAASAWGQQIESRAVMLKGTSLPGSCTVGERFFKTDASAGSNLYGCTTTNNWTVMSGGTGTGLCVNPLGAAKTSSTVLTLNGSCSSGAPAVVAVGTTGYQFTNSYTLTISGTSDSGNVYICLTTAGALVAKHNENFTLTPSSGITVATGQTSCGSDFTLHVPTVASNVWDTLTAAMDYRPQLYFKPSPTAGANVTVTPGNIDTIASSGGSGGGGMLSWSLGNINLNTGTWYTWPGSSFINSDTYAVPIPSNCTAANLRVYVPNSVNAGGNIVVTLRNVTGAADTSMTTTIAAGSSAGVYSDTSNTPSLTGGSRYILRVDNNSTAVLNGNWGFALACN